MGRQVYLEMARRGVAMPIGTDMVLRERPESESLLLDGVGLGKVVVEAAGRYGTPLAVALMDLRVEKEEMLRLMGVETADVDAFKFGPALPDGAAGRLLDRLNDDGLAGERQLTNERAMSYVRANSDKVAVGMAVGPFSLITKLMEDPITAVYLSGSGTGREEDPDVAMLEDLIRLSTEITVRSVRRQVRAGAQAIVICEPAANVAYFSPIQLEQGSDVYERLVMRANRKVRDAVEAAGADFILHNCGELTDDMVSALASLWPVMLSLGSSRKLWDDEKYVPKDVVMYGNLPTKKFYSDAEMPLAAVETRTREIATRMKATGHPFVLGSECDVLSVPGSHETIRRKVEVMLEVGREVMRG